MKINLYLCLLFLILMLMLITIFIYLFIFKYKLTNSESFENPNIILWSDDLKERFIKYQRTVGENNYIYNLHVLQKQVSPEEAEEYLKSGYWEWPEYLKDLFKEKVRRNNLIKVDPGIALENALKVYNKNAMKEMIAWNSKEGNFLLYGVNVGPNINIKCGTDDKSGNSLLQKVIHKDSVYYKTNIENQNIPNIVPGFSFINEPCNPCSALDSDYSCPFEIKIKKDKYSDLGSNSDFRQIGISKIWKELWSIQ
jgi:hypothetical protein